MKKHLLLTCLAYLAFGVGMTVQYLGIKAGLGLHTTIGIYVTCLLFFLVVVFTSMQKVKDKLFEKEESGTKS